VGAGDVTDDIPLVSMNNEVMGAPPNTFAKVTSTKVAGAQRTAAPPSLPVENNTYKEVANSEMQGDATYMQNGASNTYQEVGAYNDNYSSEYVAAPSKYGTLHSTNGSSYSTASRFGAYW